MIINCHEFVAEKILKKFSSGVDISLLTEYIVDVLRDEHEKLAQRESIKGN